MNKNQISKEFIVFLSAAKSPFHAVDFMKGQLLSNGFKQLEEKETWALKKKGKYFLIRGKSSLVAFTMGEQKSWDSGFKMIGAHTDSPCLKLKNQPERPINNYLTLGVEPYGGILLSTWFDRDLSLAGSVSYLDGSGNLHSRLIDFKRAIGVLPNLAIHLNPKANESLSINKQTDLPVLVMQSSKNKSVKFREIVQKELMTSASNHKIKEVLDFDLVFYDTQTPSFVGLDQEFITGQRLDNLLSCFCGLKALISAKGSLPSLLVCNDHEEVGSNSNTGAAGTLLVSVLERICDTRENFRRTLAKSLLVSVDNAHGVHPNFTAKHEENHKPLLNEGPVIKINANQRYATNSDTSSLFRLVCKKAQVPVQSYVNRSDMACGTTIGPITSTNLGVDTLDIGVATFAMHSIRETCGAFDIWYLFKSLKTLIEMEKNG